MGAALWGHTAGLALEISPWGCASGVAVGTHQWGHPFEDTPGKWVHTFGDMLLQSHEQWGHPFWDMVVADIILGHHVGLTLGTSLWGHAGSGNIPLGIHQLCVRLGVGHSGDSGWTCCQQGQPLGDVVAPGTFL